jgi:hypothetical protein
VRLLGIGKQLRELGSAASGGPSSAYKATNTAMRNATSTAMGEGRHSLSAVTKPDASVTKSIRSAINGSVHPGSTAGWKGSKSVHLAHNNTGYFNPANQKARYTSKKLRVPSVNIPVSYNSVSLNKSTDYRLGRSHSDSPSVLKRKGK